jgi:molecular chaperone GrpE
LALEAVRSAMPRRTEAKELFVVEETNGNKAAAPSRDGSEAASEAQAPGVTQEAFDELQARAKEYLDGWQRARADFTNYKKRVDSQMLDSYQNASSDVLKSLLPIIDDFDRAIASVPADLADNPWVTGTSMIQRKLSKMLDDFGVKPIDPRGEVFDPNRAEAVGVDEDSDAPSGTVTETLQKGYRVGERILRPAMVRVAR